MLVVILALAGFTAYKLLTKKETNTAEKTEAPLPISKNSDAFNMSFSNLMKDYYELKDAFIHWDTAAADKAALSLQKSVDSLQLKELKADSTIIQTAEAFTTSLDGDIKGLLGEKSIEEKRKEFNILTDELYNLVRVVRYDREKIYHVKCPMAFSDSIDGYWLSSESKIANPYLGDKHPTYKNKMLDCGEIIDSLDFSKK